MIYTHSFAIIGVPKPKVIWFIQGDFVLFLVGPGGIVDTTENAYHEKFHFRSQNQRRARSCAVNNQGDIYVIDSGTRQPHASVSDFC